MVVTTDVNRLKESPQVRRLLSTVVDNTKGYRINDFFIEADPQSPSSYEFGVKVNGSYPLPPVSAIVPTYNRSPYPADSDKNPLRWCLDSLDQQAWRSGLDEVVIVDDNSRDYTSDVVEDFASKSRLDVTYVKNSENRGSSVAKNLGMKNSRNGLGMFLDDDCVFGRWMVFGANYTMNELGEDAAVVHVPIYHRSNKPFLIEGNQIGSLDLERGVMTGNFGGFPIGYEENPEAHFLNEHLGIFEPLEIRNLGGIFLTKKAEFEKAGGYPEYFTWKNGYREETNVSLALQAQGKKVFFTPDPKFFCTHLKYGARESEEGFVPNTGDPVLDRQVMLSNCGTMDTGNRVAAPDWFHDFILSTYVTLGLYDRAASERYAENAFKNFVVDNDFAMSGVGTKINEPSERRAIFDAALSEGRTLVDKLTA